MILGAASQQRLLTLIGIKITSLQRTRFKTSSSTSSYQSKYPHGLATTSTSSSLNFRILSELDKSSHNLNGVVRRRCPNLQLITDRIRRTNVSVINSEQVAGALDHLTPEGYTALMQTIRRRTIERDERIMELPDDLPGGSEIDSNNQMNLSVS